MSSPLPMFYQSGYLTIKEYDARRKAFVLGLPNQEVSQGLAESLIAYYGDEQHVNALGNHYGFLDRFAEAIRSGDMENGLEYVHSYLSNIPYVLSNRDERDFQTVFFLVFSLLGAQMDVEVRTATGRIDAVVENDDAIYVMEFKFNRSAAEALAQIEELGYLKPYMKDSRRLVAVGVNFSPDEWTIDDWVIHEVPHDGK